MKTIRRPKMRDQVSEQIKQLIVQEKLMPGDRLPTETQLAETFGISRLSLREATKTLEFLGIIESKTGVGLTVGRLDMGRLTSHLGFHSGLIDADPQQLIDSRVIIETGVLPHVVSRMADDPSVVREFQELVDQFRSARSVKAAIGIDIQFHQLLVETSGLQPIIAFNELLAVFFQRFYDAIKKVDLQVGIEHHQRLVDLLAAGNLDAAIADLRVHIEANKERL
ncbi:MAG: GntR family transcriptional regulator [Planctomycetaceae bacterium]|nr:FadR family transcriptional regulator [Planctomycetaceae bacterium]MCA9131180.1 FadR family transcriptional regulator [Planctomycetales bacterium]